MRFDQMSAERRRAMAQYAAWRRHHTRPVCYAEAQAMVKAMVLALELRWGAAQRSHYAKTMMVPQ